MSPALQLLSILLVALPSTHSQLLVADVTNLTTSSCLGWIDNKKKKLLAKWNANGRLIKPPQGSKDIALSPLEGHTGLNTNNSPVMTLIH